MAHFEAKVPKAQFIEPFNGLIYSVLWAKYFEIVLNINIFYLHINIAIHQEYKSSFFSKTFFKYNN